MSSFLGQLGRLVKLKCPSGQATERSERYSFTRTVEGRVKAQVKPLSRRSWQVDITTATPSDIGTLMSFTLGEWGNGPFVWVAEGAAVTNMLTPDVASCGPKAVQAGAVTIGGPLLLPDGSWAPRSLLNSTPASSLFFGPSTVPVIPGRAVTGSAFVMGTLALVGVQFYDAAGVAISSIPSSGLGVADVSTRVSVTATPPANAASCRVYTTRATQAALPALTWTPQVMEWGAGQGCDRAVISAPNQSLVLALDHPTYGRYTDVSFTIREVG